MADTARWVVDTMIYNHFWRAGCAHLIESLAPGRVVLVPRDVDTEIERGRLGHTGVPAVSAVAWAELAVLTEDEAWTQLEVKAQMGGGPDEHLGESAVIACAYHRRMTAVMDERAAIAQADRFGVPCRDTLWIVIEAYKELFGRDRGQAAKVVDALLGTGLYLPIDSGESLMVRAYEEGLLP